jgi:hypothetical protein
MRKLIEASRRKADVDIENCTPITLADGQSWYFPRPWLEIRPIFRAGKATANTRMLTCGNELDTLLEAIGTEEDGISQAMLILTLGAFLLMRNYDIKDEELGRLFILRPNDPDSDRILHEILDVATGHGVAALGWRILIDPKACAAG